MADGTHVAELKTRLDNRMISTETDITGKVLVMDENAAHNVPVTVLVSYCSVSTGPCPEPLSQLLLSPPGPVLSHLASCCCLHRALP